MVEPGGEDLVEPGAACARAAEHAEHVVAHRARIVLGQEDERLQDLGRGAREVGAGVGLGQVLQRRAGAALEFRAFVDQLGQGAPEACVLGRCRQRAALQPGLGEVGDADAAWNEFTARTEGALDAVEHRARRRIALGEHAVDVLDDVPGHARVGADADRGERERGCGAAGERDRAGTEGGGKTDEAGSAEHGVWASPAPAHERARTDDGGRY